MPNLPAFQLADLETFTFEELALLRVSCLIVFHHEQCLLQSSISVDTTGILSCTKPGKDEPKDSPSQA